MLSKLRLRLTKTCGMAIMAVALSGAASGDLLEQWSTTDTLDQGFGLDLPDLPPLPPPLGGGPNETDHTAQDPSPPDKEPPPPVGGWDPLEPYGPDLWEPIESRISDMLQQLSASEQELNLVGSYNQTVGYGYADGAAGPLAPVPAPGVLTLLGLGALLGPARRRK